MTENHEPISTEPSEALEVNEAEHTPSRFARIKKFGRLAMIGTCLYGLPAGVAGISGELPHTSEQFGPLTITLRGEAGVKNNTRLSTIVGDQQLDEHYGYGIDANVSQADIKKIETAARSKTPLETLTRSITADRKEIVFDHLGVQLSREDSLKLRFAAELMLAIGGSTAVMTFAGGEFARRKLNHDRRAPVLKSVGMGVLAVGLTLGGLSFRDTEKAGRTGIFAYVADRQDLAKRLDSYDARYGHTAASSLALVDSIISKDKLPSESPSLCLLMVSDRHQRDILPLLKEYIRLNDCIAAVVDGGDQVDWGQDFENDSISDPSSIGFRNLTMSIKDLGVPYLVVKGNHDNVRTMKALKDAGAIELNGEIENIGDLRVMGQGRLDKGDNSTLFTPDKGGNATSKDSDVARAYVESQISLGKELAKKAAVADPDLLVVHFPKSAEELYGLAPIVMTGHTHKQKFEQKDGDDGDPFERSFHLQIGSTGAGGLRNEDNGHPEPQQLMIAKFDASCQFIGVTSLSFDSLGTGERRAEDFWNDDYDPDIVSDRSCVSPRLQQG